MRADRFRLALDLGQAQVFKLEDGLDHTVGVRGDLHGPRLGGLLHPGSQVDGVAQSGVFHPQIGADLSHYYQAGVDAYANLDVDAPPGPHVFPVGCDIPDDLQPGPNGPLRVVFMADGGAEERQYGVSHQPGQRPFVTVDRGDQVLKGPVHNLGPLFRVQLFSGGGGPADIAEEHGDDAAFTLCFPALSGGLQLIRELRRDVTLEVGPGGIGGGFRSPGLAHLMAAAKTEASLPGQFGAAFRAEVGQGVPAGHAKPGAVRVFAFTTGTVHVRL